MGPIISHHESNYFFREFSSPKNTQSLKTLENGPKTSKNVRKHTKMHQNGRNVQTTRNFDFFQATSRPGLWQQPRPLRRPPPWPPPRPPLRLRPRQWPPEIVQGSRELPWRPRQRPTEFAEIWQNWTAAKFGKFANTGNARFADAARPAWRGSGAIRG